MNYGQSKKRWIGLLLISKVIDSMNVGKSSQLAKHGFGSLQNLTRTCYHNQDILLRYWLLFTHKVN